MQRVATEIRQPNSCSEKEIAAFCSAVQKGDEVEPKGLKERVERAKTLAFLYMGTALVGVAALKQPNVSYRDDVFKKAEVPLIATDFELELGWVYVSPDQRGKHFSEVLSTAAISQSKGTPVFATTRLDNLPMQRALERVKFSSVGVPYSSKRGDYKLLLYVNLNR